MLGAKLGAGLAGSHPLLVAAYALLIVYVRQRFPQGPPALAAYWLAALAAFPTRFFLRMAYTESLFLVLCLVATLGMERHLLWAAGCTLGDERHWQRRLSGNNKRP